MYIRACQKFAVKENARIEKMYNCWVHTIVQNECGELLVTNQNTEWLDWVKGQSEHKGTIGD